MQSNRRFATYSIATAAISALVTGIGALSAMLGVSVGAIALGAVAALACVVAFTLLIWAAIQDGKQPDRTAAQ
jgi:hypothetical protein